VKIAPLLGWSDLPPPHSGLQFYRGYSSCVPLLWQASMWLNVAQCGSMWLNVAGVSSFELSLLVCVSSFSALPIGARLTGEDFNKCPPLPSLTLLLQKFTKKNTPKLDHHPYSILTGLVADLLTLLFG
jgi:hypothetical protein